MGTSWDDMTGTDYTKKLAVKPTGATANRVTAAAMILLVVIALATAATAWVVHLNAAKPSAAEKIQRWLDTGDYYALPCVSRGEDRVWLLKDVETAEGRTFADEPAVVHQPGGCGHVGR